ncbi:chemotaxis protein CheA [Puniceicoccaceae bacterium K14]|nr:chemotaxis protein CheA [Puniceicoccaceae bacterium K14]
MPDEDLQKELIRDLIIESVEGLDRYDQELLEFENDHDAERMNVIFRVIHTIKGTAGCLGLGRIEKVAHVGENLLSLLRDDKLKVHEGMISVLLSLSDALKEMLDTLENTESEGDKDYGELIAKLDALQNEDAEPQAETPETDDSQSFGLFEDEEEADEVSASADEEGTAFGFFDDEEEPQTEDTPESVQIEEAPVNQSEPTPTKAETPKAKKPTKPNCSGSSNVADSSIRVDVNHLDRMMNMVGELVLARNQIIVNSTNYDENALIKASQRLNLITTELQESVMKTRMQPIGNVWSKFPRIVRDVSSEIGKKVNLIMEGKETDLDRTIIEAIKDPLTHIIRNSIDHGIETPEKRIQEGKPEEGMLSLRAYHEGGQVIIEIMDDGAGIDIERVKSKAIEKNLITSSQGSNMTEREAMNLIFSPGFSTAAKVSNVSGRGVGMDVVKTNIEKIGGSIDLQTQIGQGTTLNIKIPLTLAIIPALIVNSSGERYAIPQVSLLELVRLEGPQAKSEIEDLYGSPVYRLRGKLLPIVFLDQQLKTRLEDTNDGFSDEDIVMNIIVLQADGRPFGLVVDQINDTEEIVVKPLGKQLKGISCFAGSTIMGDGKLALILDVLGLAQHSGVITDSDNRALLDDDKSESDIESRKQSMLLFNIGEDRRMALPLSLAARLEEFSEDQIENTGSQQVVQYRGQILPLIRVADHIQGINTSNEYEGKTPNTLQVIVYTENDRSIGLVVDNIRDIVDEEIVIQRESSTAGIKGCAVIQNKVSELLDAPEIIKSADPGFYASAC